MTSLAPQPLDSGPPLARYDHVRVPDGRVGYVVGFYRRTVESVLVSFSPGVSEEFLRPDVQAVSH